MDDNHQYSLLHILESIRHIPDLQPQERRVVLRELVEACCESDVQALQRIFGITTRSGFDMISVLPIEISRKIFVQLDGMDLVRCRAVCRPWRSMIRNDAQIWKAKILDLNPAECSLLIDYRNRDKDKDINKGEMKKSDEHSGTTITKIAKACTHYEMILDQISCQHSFPGWEATLIRELALAQNWKQGRLVHETTIELTRDIKPTLLAWPYLVLVDAWPNVFVVSLDQVQKDRLAQIPFFTDPYCWTWSYLHQSPVSCLAWDSTGGETLSMALGGFLRTVRICNPLDGSSLLLPDVHHGFPLHLCFLQDYVISVMLDGQVNYFKKGEDYRLLRSCSVDTKAIQVVTVQFGYSTERDVNGSKVSWSEAICLAHEEGVIILDENASTLARIRIKDGARLIHFQAIADHDKSTVNAKTDVSGVRYNRNELLILFEEPVARQRQRRVLVVKMELGFQGEISREELPQNAVMANLGRGGDARDSVTMFRDRIAVVSHTKCSSDLGHYCVLRVVNLRRDCAFSTEYRKPEEEVEEEEVVEEEGVQGDEDKGGHMDENDEARGHNGDDDRKAEAGPKRLSRSLTKQRPPQPRGRLIHLDVDSGSKAACRVLTMDHARIVLGVGPRMVRILFLV
ncbi:hypothetical protein CPC16_003204 [Podila verticillata]|nr:hypothetical protein CPC16_003204 [Podila verticillata]